MKLKISGKELRSIGYPESPVIPIAMEIIHREFKHSALDEVLVILKNVLANPHDFLEDEKLGKLASRLMPQPAKNVKHLELRTEGIGFNTFGAEHIEPGALHQMHQAAKLPISVAGALMPDAHHGYGLPIGGVLATKNAIIPYGVGVDIGCRMCLSIFDLPVGELQNKSAFFERELQANTLFGSGAQFTTPHAHDIMDHPLFHELAIAKPLHGKAWKQLGSSGSGNHFVEFGIVSIPAKDEVLSVEPGDYLGLLSHSGSRALGANIANHYTKLAKEKRKLPAEAANLAWLTLDEEAGIEYWLAMNLAGEYASACHHVIHDRIAKQLGRTPVKRVENHHNFAWKELYNGEEVIVHRKGATPAGKDVLGIIPGSMTANGYIVKGLGEAASIQSASHGAGRKMSRSKAESSITRHAMNEELAKHGVTLFGGGLDEAPFAYKDIDLVMKSQQNLVSTLGSFTPKIVRMAGHDKPAWKKKGRVLPDGQF